LSNLIYSPQDNLLHVLTLICSYGGERTHSNDRNLTLDEINVLIRHENNLRVLKRLYFVKFEFLGDSVEEAATKVGVTKKTGYYWQDDWNKGGYAALILNFGGIILILGSSLFRVGNLHSFPEY
jgi:hypothetical protein